MGKASVRSDKLARYASICLGAQKTNEIADVVE